MHCLLSLALQISVLNDFFFDLPCKQCHSPIVRLFLGFVFAGQPRYCQLAGEFPGELFSAVSGRADYLQTVEHQLKFSNLIYVQHSDKAHACLNSDFGQTLSLSSKMIHGKSRYRIADTIVDKDWY